MPTQFSDGGGELDNLWDDDLVRELGPITAYQGGRGVFSAILSSSEVDSFDLSPSHSFQTQPPAPVESGADFLVFDNSPSSSPKRTVECAAEVFEPCTPNPRGLEVKKKFTIKNLTIHDVAPSVKQYGSLLGLSDQDVYFALHSILGSFIDNSQLSHFSSDVLAVAALSISVDLPVVELVPMTSLNVADVSNAHEVLFSLCERDCPDILALRPRSGVNMLPSLVRDSSMMSVLNDEVPHVSRSDTLGAMTRSQDCLVQSDLALSNSSMELDAHLEEDVQIQAQSENEEEEDEPDSADEDENDLLKCSVKEIRRAARLVQIPAFGVELAIKYLTKYLKTSRCLRQPQTVGCAALWYTMQKHKAELVGLGMKRIESRTFAAEVNVARGNMFRTVKQVKVALSR